MTKHNLKLVLNEEFFDTSLTAEEFQERIEREQEAGNFPQIFLYDNNGRFKGVNAKHYSEAAIRLLAKIRQPKEVNNDN